MIKKGLCIILATVVAAALPFWCFAESVATMGVTSEVYDIFTGEPIAENLEDLQGIVDSYADIELVDDSVLTVVVPSHLNFTIDPFQLSGRGQIYSDNFLLQNYGRTDVTVRLENIKYTFVNETDFVSLDSPPETPFGLRRSSELKEIYMLLHYENRDLDDFVITTKERSETADIVLAAAEYDDNGNFVSLNEESSLIFNFTGIVNHMPAIEWENSDVVISITYTIVADETDEANIGLDAEEAVKSVSRDEEALPQAEPESAGEHASGNEPEKEPETSPNITELSPEPETPPEKPSQLEDLDGGEGTDEGEHSVTQSEPQGLSADE